MACRVQSITNNIAQTVATNSIIQLGFVNCNNQTGTTITITCSGKYYIDTQVIATPSANTTSGIALNINGIPFASVSRATTQNLEQSIYEVRGIFNLQRGDIITITNVGEASLDLAVPGTTNGYNISTIIERL